MHCSNCTELLCILYIHCIYNVTLTGLLTRLLNHLQSILNAVAGLIAIIRIIPQMLLPVVTGYIYFKVAVTVYWALHGTAPRYLSDLLYYVANLQTINKLQFCTSRQFDNSSLSVIAHFLQLDHDSGTAFLKMSSLPHHWQHFIRNWNCTYFNSHIWSLLSCSTTIAVDLQVTTT